MLKLPGMKHLAGGWLEGMSSAAVTRLQLMFLGMHKDPSVLDCIRGTRKAGRGGPLANEGFILYSLARAQTKVVGDFAEVGVFRGASARLICEGKGDKTFHLFDTFAGLPKTTDVDQEYFHEKQYACSRESVAQYLGGFSNMRYHEGLFPDSTRGNIEVESARYALCHFDVDLYQGTKACLEFFYPRMSPAGIIVSHDYSFAPGVKQAFDEFMADKPEGLIELPTSQCMFVKQ